MRTWEDMWTDKTIGSALASATARFGSKDAMIFENGTLTFEQLKSSSELVAGGLSRLGVRKGDMVAIWMAGYMEWAPIHYGIGKLGGIMVPVNTRYKPSEVESVLNKSKAKALFLKDERAAGKNYLGVLRELYPEMQGGSSGRLASKRIPHLRHVIISTEGNVPGSTSFSEFLNEGRKVPSIEYLNHPDLRK